jgi:hypothetical protein
VSAPRTSARRASLVRQRDEALAALARQRVTADDLDRVRAELAQLQATGERVAKAMSVSARASTTAFRNAAARLRAELASSAALAAALVAALREVAGAQHCLHPVGGHACDCCRAAEERVTAALASIDGGEP